MPNRCVAAGCGNMPSDSVSLFRFPKDPHLCGVWTRQVQRTRVNRVLTSMAVPSSVLARIWIFFSKKGVIENF